MMRASESGHWRRPGHGRLRQKRTGSIPMGERSQNKCGRPGAARCLKSEPCRCDYPWMVGCRAGCISTAATLRQTAAAVANVKSAIHMARFPRSARLRLRPGSAQSTSNPAIPFLGLRPSKGKIKPFLQKNRPHEVVPQPALRWVARATTRRQDHERGVFRPILTSSDLCATIRATIHPSSFVGRWAGVRCSRANERPE
jgi:hypothetical protein